MKVLLIHTYYVERGGEDMVFETESSLLRSKNIGVETMIFKNKDHTSINFLIAPFNIFSYYKVKNKIKQFNPDVIHIHNWHFAASPAIVWAANKLKIPVVMTLHNYRLLCPSGILFHKGELFFESLSGGFPWKAVEKGVYKNSKVLTFWLATVIRWHRYIGTWRKVDRFITLSEFAKNIFLKSDLNISADKISVKPNFTQSLITEPQERQLRFVYIGRLSAEKGLDVIFKAFQIRKFELVIIGDGPLREQVEAFVKNNPEVKYMGFQSSEIIQQILQSSTALIFSSKCYETMGMTILESFANGTPVIASALGSVPDIITDDFNGLLFNNDDANDLALKIGKWIEIPTERKSRFCDNARNTFLEKYSADRNFDQLISIYKETL